MAPKATLLSSPRSKVQLPSILASNTWSSIRVPERSPQPAVKPWLWGDNSTPISLPSSMFNEFDSDGFLSGSNGNPEQVWLGFDSEDFFYLLNKFY